MARFGIIHSRRICCGRHDRERGDHCSKTVHFEGGGSVEGVVIMKLKFLFIVMDLLTLLVYPIGYLFGKIHHFKNEGTVRI